MKAPGTELLYSSFTLAGLELANRLVMSPMTRSRGTLDNRPGPLAATYYAQRASAGLIITEGTQTSAAAKGFSRVPGIFTDVQIAEWREVTDAVHFAGGKIFVQLWHCGRISHHLSQPGHQPPVAPSAIRAEAFVVLDDGTRVETDMPRPFETAELPLLIDEFVAAGRNAIAAGFDGVELHGANGYLLHQFLSPSTNLRTDGYGTTPAGRMRLVLELAEAVGAAIGRERTGIRLSPLNRYNDIGAPDSEGFYSDLIGELDRIGLGYIHMVEGQAGLVRDLEGIDHHAWRRRFSGAWIANNLYDRDLAEAALRTGSADLISFGRPFIANPDLVERYRIGAPLNEVDFATAYRGDAPGYTDYPFLTDRP
jgi:N-ethylmaleimide reductase